MRVILQCILHLEPVSTTEMTAYAFTLISDHHFLSISFDILDVGSSVVSEYKHDRTGCYLSRINQFR